MHIDNETCLIHMFVLCHNIVDLFPMDIWHTLSQVSQGIAKAILDPGMEKLLPHQRLHCRNLRFILQKTRRGIDTSPLGAGKSYIATALGKSLGLFPVILAPNATRKNWRDAASHIGVKHQFYQYSVFQRKPPPFTQALGAAERMGPMEIETAEASEGAPDLSEWDGVIRGTEHNQTGLALSQEWRHFLQKPILLVLDESQLLKNNSMRTKIVTMMVRSIYELGHPRSCVLLASATPFEQRHHVIRLMRLLNIWESDQLAVTNPHLNRQELRGLQEIIDYANWIMPSKYPVNFTGTLHEKAYKWIMHRIYPNLTSAMPPGGLPFHMDAKNLFYNLSGPQLNIVRNGVNELDQGVTSLYLAHLQGDELGKIARAMLQIEKGKIGLFITCAKKILEQKQTKVVILLNYTETLKQVAKWLAPYHPIIINGETKMGSRPEMIGRFQEPNLNCRVLIGNLGILAQGVDLDDQHGAFPRHMIISPSYFLSRLYQATGRILRSKTKSQPRAHFIYVKQVPTETDLLTSLAMKSNILQQSVKHRLRLPAQYPSVSVSNNLETLKIDHPHQTIPH